MSKLTGVPLAVLGSRERRRLPVVTARYRDTDAAARRVAPAPTAHRLRYRARRHWDGWAGGSTSGTRHSAGLGVGSAGS